MFIAQQYKFVCAINDSQFLQHRPRRLVQTLHEFIARQFLNSIFLDNFPVKIPLSCQIISISKIVIVL